MNIKELFTPEVIQKLISAAIGISLFFISYGIIKKILGKFAYPKLKQNTAFLLKKGIKYAFYVLLVIYILGLFNIKLTALFGAAGIAGIAIGFAAQTSVSNIISGLFLLTEHSLKVGDYISANGESGTIDSIDMLSVRIHTPDNQFIRIPNESIINANLKNNSYFDLA
ncbi:MAG: mechanosensitive ion channel [Spirochaetaceae bacterium]|nr:mechanosensitive ion channel [Spirochaetaceae bacterium]